MTVRVLYIAPTLHRVLARPLLRRERGRGGVSERVRRGLAGGEQAAGRAARTARAAAPGGGGPRRTLAVSSCFLRSDLYARAISGTSGSSGFGSVSSEHTESSTFEIVSAGLHWLCKMSRQMLPLLFTLQW